MPVQATLEQAAHQAFRQLSMVGTVQVITSITINAIATPMLATPMLATPTIATPTITTQC